MKVAILGGGPPEVEDGAHTAPAAAAPVPVLQLRVAGRVGDSIFRAFVHRHGAFSP